MSAREFVLEDGTPVRLRLNRTVSSADSHVGDTVDFEVLQDFRVSGTLVIPKGGLAFGTVTDVQPTRRVARGGKIEIHLEYVRLLDGEKARLRAIQDGKGGSHILAMTAGIVATGLTFFPAAPFFLLMHGKDIVIPKGAEVTAYVNGGVRLSVAKFQRPIASTATQPVAVDSGTSYASPNLGKVQTESSLPPGFFLDHTYTNDYFSLSYRLPPDWVLATDLIRKKLSSERDSKRLELLLAAVHIPQDVTELRTDSFLTLLALARSAQGNTENCRQYLDTLTSSLRAGKSAKRKGEVSEYTVAGHEFSRANLEYSSGTSHQALICSPAKDYLLVWKVEAALWDSLDEAASTIYAITPWPPEQTPRSPGDRTQIYIPLSTSGGLLLRKVQPVYPAEARENHIQGTVRMQVVISKTGDVVSLELLEGPIELTPSAVYAVRQWKYRPYLVSGEPVEVSTEVVINYSVRPSLTP